MFKKISLLIIGLLIITIMSSSGIICNNILQAADMRIVTDMVGREIEISQPVEKIVGLGPGCLRLITYLKATDKVVGVEQIEIRDNKRPYVLAVSDLTKLSAVGPMHGGDAELITAADPDLIFHTYIEPGEADKLQRKTGIPVVVINYGGIGDRKRETLYQGLRLMGEILNKEDRVRELIDYISSLIDDLKRKTADLSGTEKPEVYTGGIGYRGAQGIVSTEPAYPPFSFLNIDNVAGNLGLEHAMISREKLLQWDPEIIFIDEGGLAQVKENLQRPEFSLLTAVKENKLYGVLPYNYYTTNFATVFANAYYIGKIVYPERFSGIQAEVKADEIYNYFLGKSVYKEMKEIFGGFKRIE